MFDVLTSGSKKKRVMEDTWGHMAPVVGKRYFGYIIAMLSSAGDMTIHDYGFSDADGKELSGGPWLLEDISRFAFDELSKSQYNDLAIIRFDGWYEKHEDDICEFGGGEFKRSNLETEVSADKFTDGWIETTPKWSYHVRTWKKDLPVLNSVEMPAMSISYSDYGIFTIGLFGRNVKQQKGGMNQLGNMKRLAHRMMLDYFESVKELLS